MNSPTVSTSVPANEGATPAGGFAQRWVLRALQDMQRGHLRLHLPDGTEVTFGAAHATETRRLTNDIPGHASLVIRQPNFFRRCLLAGDIGFAESYLDGEWETPDLTALIAWFIQNVDTAPTMSGSQRSSPLLLNLLRGANRLSHLLRPNSRRTARRNIREHYDLSNDFFSLFLDPTLMYSSALWTRQDQTLEEAQTEKNDRLCRSLRLTAGDHVLEIGTGWGGWSLHAARRYGCKVTTVTISEQQFHLARRRVEEAGLTDRIEVRLQDYRDIEGTFDKLVSIEMLEAVGHRYHREYFRTCARLVKPQGLIALQFITCPDGRYEALRRGVDFIQKHIFPGSLLLSLNRVNTLMSEEGNFSLVDLHDFGPDYGRTLRLWREAFLQRLEQVRALGFDERFIRKWHYYLSYCEAAFSLRNISVVHTLHTRPNNLTLS